MINSEPKIERLLKETYLQAVRNSVGSKMFRNLYISVDDISFDATRDGELSCAYYVSSLLTIFQLAERFHGTVTATIKDIENHGWYKVDQPEIGSVIIWEATNNPDTPDDNGNEHIGFYVGDSKAISNSTPRRKVEMHDWIYGGTRVVSAVYSHEVLKKLA